MIEANDSVSCNYEIKKETKTIADYAFNKRNSLTNVTFPDSIISIGDYAFSDCISIESITIPDSVTSIGSYAFYGCTSLTSLTIGNSVTSIGDYAFQACLSLISVTIPDSVTSIGDHAFDCCESLTSIIIPDSVTSIGNCAFLSCVNLANVIIGNGVKNIGDYAFDDCDSLEIIKVNKDNKIFDSRNNCSAIIETSTNTLIKGCQNTTIPDSVTSIGSYAFYYCTDLTSITIPDSVTSIGGYAFYYCTGLTSIAIPDCVTSIGYRAFCCCKGLTSMTIPDSVTSIGETAFAYCTKLTSITIGSGVTSIGEEAFKGCESLTSVTVDKDNKTYDSRNNCNAIIETSTNTLIQGCQNTTIPDSVTSIGDSAFCGCTGLTSITIPDSVTSIGEEAFRGCTSLTSVTIPDSVMSIGNYAFCACTSLTCVTIPDSVTSIGECVFFNCTTLTDVYYSGSEAEWNEITIETGNDCLTSATIHFIGTPVEPPIDDETITIKNIDSGVKVNFNKNAFADDVDVNNIKLNVKKTSADAEFDKVAKDYAMTRVPGIDVYNISLTCDGEEVQPNDKVTVRIAYSGSIDDISKVKVFHYYEEKGEFHSEKITGIKFIAGYLEFETSHFSNFVFVTDEKTEEPVTKLEIIGSDTMQYKNEQTLKINSTLAVEYKSDNEKVASVDPETGKVTAVGSGTATITATIKGTDISATKTITVKYAWWQWIVRILLLGFIWY